MLTIKKIMYKPPATIVFWNDGTKTVSVCEKGDAYNKELGFALCVLKKKYGNKTVHKMLEQYVHNAKKYSHKDKAVIWENKPIEYTPYTNICPISGHEEKKSKEKGFRKPNAVKKRVRLHSRPDRYIELTLEPIENESTYNLLKDFFDFYNFL